MKNLKKSDATNLSIFSFGIIIFHNTTLALNLKKIGYVVFEVRGKYFGLNFPRWFFALERKY